MSSRVYRHDPDHDVHFAQLTNMTLSAYFQKYIAAPAGLNSTFYWVGGQGLEPTGIRKGVVSLPAYSATFKVSSGGGKGWSAA